MGNYCRLFHWITVISLLWPGSLAGMSTPARAEAQLESRFSKGDASHPVQSHELEEMSATGNTLAETRDGAITEAAVKARALEAYGQLPLSFIPNQGQVDEQVSYYAQARGHSLWFTADGVTMALPEATVRLKFPDANPTVQIYGTEQLPSVVNYFTGNDPAHWQSNIPTYGQITYHDLWPGVDLTYEGKSGVLKSTFILAPGADLAQIRLSYSEADRLTIDEQGRLIIQIDQTEISESPPIAWQEINGQRIPVEARYALLNLEIPIPHPKSEIRNSKSVGFILGPHNPAYPLIIDPTLEYSTFVGSISAEYGYALALDGIGNVVVTGATNRSDFPTTAGAYDIGYNGGGDFFVSKLAADGGSLLYSTFVGGSGREVSWALALDGAGNVVVTGHTGSTDFPTTVGAYDTDYNGGSYDAFVLKLAADGGSLLYSTFVGGSGEEYYGGFAPALALDGIGNAVVTGHTGSADFPTTAGAYDTDHNGGPDVFVLKLAADGGSLLYSTFVGGSSRDDVEALALDGAGNVVVTGATSSTDFPTTAGAYDTGYNGGGDVFVSKLAADGGSLLYSTFVGGSKSDHGYALALDGAGNVVVTGFTLLAVTDFPTTAGAYDTGYNGGFNDTFILKLAADGGSLLYSTFVGGSGEEIGVALALDQAGNVVVTGATQSTNFPITVGAYDTGFNGGGQDAFILKLAADGGSLLYSTFVGGSDIESGYALALDGIGNVVVTGYARSADFPTRPFYRYGEKSNVKAFFVTQVDRLIWRGGY